MYCTRLVQWYVLYVRDIIPYSVLAILVGTGQHAVTTSEDAT